MDKLFFELASESRLAILSALLSEELKLQEVARRVDITPTEALRQLNRLGEALLVQRRPDGAYSISNYGRLVMRLSPSLGFLHRHRDYFRDHDLERLPAPFISRIGELEGTTLVMDTLTSIDRGQRMFLEAERFGWAITEGNSPEIVKPLMEERIRQGLTMRFIVPHDRLPGRPVPPEMAGVLEVRGIPEVPAIVILTDKEAMVCLRFLDGRMDYAGLFGTAPAFLGWARDLMLHYWERGRGP